MQALQKELSYILTERDSHNTAGNIVVSKVNLSDNNSKSDEGLLTKVVRSVKQRLEGLPSHGLKLIFIDKSVNFDVFHCLIRRRLGVDSSFTSGVRVRTTTTCIDEAQRRRRPAEQSPSKGHGRRRRVLLVSNK